MLNQDRGIIKWTPFESVAPSKSMVKDILNEKSKISIPILSEEQIKSLENSLIIAYHEQTTIEVNYYKSGSIKKIISNIKKIDPTSHKIYFNNTTLIFEQIIAITTI